MEHALVGLGVGKHDGSWRRTEEFFKGSCGLETVPVLHKTRFDAANRPAIVDRTFDDEDDRKRTGFIDRGKRRFRTLDKSSAHSAGWTSGPPAQVPPIALFSPRSPWSTTPARTAPTSLAASRDPSFRGAAPAPAPAPPRAPPNGSSPRRLKPVATPPKAPKVPEAPPPAPSPRTARVVAPRRDDPKLLPRIPPVSATPPRNHDWRPVLGIPAMKPPPSYGSSSSPRQLRLNERAAGRAAKKLKLL